MSATKELVVVERREIDGEKAYPCYSIHVQFARPRTEADEGHFTTPNWLIEGRPEMVRDSSQVSVMEREELSEARIAEIVAGIVARYQEKHPTAEVLESKAQLTHWETWGLGWFNHFTYPEGRSDEELIASFNRYVGRHEGYQDNWMAGREDGEYKICLMGAEDRWRWRGENDDRDNPICRCEGCTKSGYVRVNH